MLYLSGEIKKSYMKHFIVLFFLNLTLISYSQELEKPPLFPVCENLEIAEIQDCFNQTLQKFIFDNFKVPEIVVQENYTGAIQVLFEVDKEGIFKLVYVDAIYQELKEETQRVFGLLPKIKPATFNAKPHYSQYTLTIKIPLSLEIQSATKNLEQEDALQNEYDSIIETPYENQEFESALAIPLSVEQYNRFDEALNKIGYNNHTSQKPFLYAEVNKYYKFSEKRNALHKNVKSWLGRKFFNEHLVAFTGKDYWLTLDPGVDLQVGKDFDASINTYNNTRLVYIQGGIGKKLNFFATIYESQGRFADYFNRYAESIKPDGGNPAIIPGMGIAKAFKKDGYDYPVATGYVSFSPSKVFNLQLGHGKNFIGDGYRSLLLSDNASPYPFFKISTTFWKIKYTNTWMSLRDVRPEVTTDGSFRTKYVANHYLSYNITKRLNIGLFESVIWENDNDRGFDFNFLNPIIFFRAIEFSTGSRGGNAIIGFTSKYKFSDRVNGYGQLVIDEFSSSDIFGGKGSYKNKIGYQLGAKYYHAFGVKGLTLQAEFNNVRPYTYSHNSVVLNYGHNNQPLAHTLGANFREFLAIARFNKGRIFSDLKISLAKRGFDFNTPEDAFSYGGDIYSSENNRPSDTGNDITQGNTTDFFHVEYNVGYLLNPATNFKIYASIIYRDFNPEVNTSTVFKNSTTWLNLGIRTDLFNWYKDF
jgi:hypothetical protein